jgi:hypothetical protein
MTGSRLFAGGILVALGSLVACEPMTPPGSAVVIEPEVPFLATEVDRALHAIGEARDALATRDGGANEPLGEAEAALARLKSYYLPLLEARQRASNAHQLAGNGETTRAEEELGHIEETLLTLARDGGEQMGRQVKEPLDLVEEVRAPLARGAPEAEAQLEKLATRLELMLLKGDLILD